MPQPLPLDHPQLQEQKLGTYGVLCLERSWDEHGALTSLWCMEQLAEENCDWKMLGLENTLNALYHFY